MNEKTALNAGIVLGGQNARLKNVHVANSEIGIAVERGASAEIDGVTFDNVKRPWEIAAAAAVTIRDGIVQNDPKTKESSNRVSGSTVGWRKLNGPPLPSFCPSCKGVFPSPNYNYAGRYFAQWNNKEPCVLCGFASAELCEGMFDLTSEVVKVLMAPDITYTMLAAVAAALADGHPDEEIHSEEVIAIVETHAPPLKSYLEKAKHLYSSPAAGWLALVVAIFSWLATNQGNTINEESLAISRSSPNYEKTLENILYAIERLEPTVKHGAHAKDAYDAAAYPPANEAPEKH